MKKQNSSKNKRINLLILITASYGGGAEKVVIDQINAMNKDLFDIHLITLRKGNIENIFNNLKNINYSCLNLPKKINLKYIIILNKYIKKNQIKILHAHLIEPELYTIPIKILNPKLKIIITKHGADEFRQKFPFSFILKINSLFTHKIISVSENRKIITSKYETLKKNQAITIYNGINVDKFKKIENISKVTELKNQFNLNNSDFIIGIIGRLIDVKGHLILISACEKLVSKIKNLKVLIIGEGDLKNELINEINKKALNNFFIFSNFKENLDEIYSILDILCIPSLREGLSTVLMEGMASQCLVIASDIENNKEVAEDNKELIYFNSGNQEHLAEKILLYYNDLKKCKEIKINARNKIIKKFNLKQNIQKIEKLYIDTINS